MNRRSLLAGLGSLPLLSVPSLRAAETKQISIMTWGGAWGDSQAAGTDTMFTAQTGISAVQERNASPGDRIIKAKINAKSQIYDIIWLSDALTAYGRQQGVLEVLDRSSPRLTNLVDLYPRFLMPDFASVVFSAAGVAYNPKYVKTPPTSFADLWRPEFKGRIVLPSFQHSFGPAVISIGALASGKQLNDAEAGFDMLERLSALDPIWVNDTDSLINAYKSEEAIVGILYRSQTYTVATQGTQVNWVFPEEGAVLISWGLGIVKGTTNLAAAELYLNTACGGLAQSQFTRTHNYPGTNRTMVGILPPELRDRASWSEDELNRLIELDYSYLAAQRANWSERWNRIVAR
jgi:putative spermidine/putrescine transport system substrate-binding protein